MVSKTITAVTTISKVTGRRFSGASALVVIYGEELGRKYDLSEGKTVIGRSSRCRIQIDH
ncbi:MAG: GGDEF domain-containing protein, partial [Myxococcaceae bacterium]|nr:GGDEF domain-containing protein [Myxococcaceae bacterium]